MKFNPMTEEEIKVANLIPDGKYPSIVLRATDFDVNGNRLLTQKGAEKTDVILNLYTPDGKERQLNAALTPAFIKLLKHFCDSTGLQDKYKAGEVTAEDINNLQCQFITVVGSRTYTKDGEERVVNQIVDFEKFDGAPVVKKSDEPFNDDVPF